MKSPSSSSCSFLGLLLFSFLTVLLAFQPPSSSSSSPSSSCQSHHHHQQHHHHHHHTPTHTSSTSTSSALSAGTSANQEEATKTCKNCLKQYLPSQNSANACCFHTGIFSGRLARIDTQDPTGKKDYFWSCCGEAKEHPGCTKEHHRSFDDLPGPWRSGFQ